LVLEWKISIISERREDPKEFDFTYHFW